nr:HD domain-containing phosphohydrolase [Desulfofundulus sp. TPOSR]
MLYHERYDGRGYPQGLKGEDTPLGARILAVADSYDAMTSYRVYRPAMTNREALEINLPLCGHAF